MNADLLSNFETLNVSSRFQFKVSADTGLSLAPQPWQPAHETRPQARRRMTSLVIQPRREIPWRSWVSPAAFDLPLPKFVTRARQRGDKKWFVQIQWVPRLGSDIPCVCVQSSARLQNSSGLWTRVQTLALRILDARLASIVVDYLATPAQASCSTTWRRSTPKLRSFSASKVIGGGWMATSFRLPQHAWKAKSARHWPCRREPVGTTYASKFLHEWSSWRAD
jgi:hypothetical protein